VSIIIPTYNRVGLLQAALDSVAAQTFGDYEIVVVDDGSSDNTRQYVSSRPEPIQYHWQPNQGVAEARNHGLRVVHSEFVAFLDSDDLWKPRFLETAVGLLRRDPSLALVYSRFVSMDERGRVLPSHNKQPFSGDVTPELFASTFIHTSAVVARSHVIRDAGGFDGRLSHNEDYDLWLRLSLRHPFGLIPEALCIRRCHPNSLAHNGCTPDVLLRKACLLHKFYEQGGGKPKISIQTAHDRLAKVYYTAGKALCRAGRAKEATDALRRSLEFDRGRLKTWLWFLRAKV
jgi:glycosyltransferase involved in cell wall biosynthesis